MNSRYILAIDPSGNHKEGKGTTGWCLLDVKTNKIAKYGVIKASTYKTQLEYWDAHIELIDSLTGYKPDIVIEDYLLYITRAQSQINSRLETPQLIGVLKYELYKRGITVNLQTAMQVKTRWTNDILVNKGYLVKVGNKYSIAGVIIVDHIQDAIRHAVHFKTFTNRYNGDD